MTTSKNNNRLSTTFGAQTVMFSGSWYVTPQGVPELPNPPGGYTFEVTQIGGPGNPAYSITFTCGHDAMWEKENIFFCGFYCTGVGAPTGPYHQVLMIEPPGDPGNVGRNKRNCEIAIVDQDDSTALLVPPAQISFVCVNRYLTSVK